METRLDEGRANIIRNSILNDHMMVGSPEWLEEHHITRDEFEAFLMAAVEYAKQLDFKRENMGVGSVEVDITFTSHSGKVGSTDSKWTAFIPQNQTNRVLSVAEHGMVRATLVPSQMAIDLDGTYVDTETGELF